jgi:hypothetical protein
MRVDFEPCFEMMDRSGQVAKVLAREGADSTKFFSQIQDGHPIREIKGTYNEGSVRRELSVTMTAITIDYQNLGGIPLDSVREDSIFSRLADLSTSIRKSFDIASELRSGLRLFYVNSITDGERAKVNNAFRNLISDSLSKIATDELSEPLDSGVSFSGGLDGEAQYAMRFGPYLGLGESPKYFQPAHPEASKKLLEDSDFIFDLDQYQIKTKLGPGLLWWKPMLTSANKIIPRIERQIANTLKANS